jgi:molecular chaperone DnaK
MAVYGIDLGTTNSCIAVVGEHGRPAVIQDQQRDFRPTLPSVVCFREDDAALVGDDAVDGRIANPSDSVALVKRQMGVPQWSFIWKGRARSAIEISSLILKKLVEIAGSSGHTVREVVITTPAWFGTVEKEATKQAGEAAGLEVLAIIPEPVAAAIAYGVKSGGPQRRVLVYDLGGGTFDVSSVRLSQAGELYADVEGYKGSIALGGADWDDRILSWVAREYERQHNQPASDITQSEAERARLLPLIEAAKRKLTTANSARIEAIVGTFPLRATLDRATFDELTADLLESSLELTRDLVAEVLERKGVAACHEVFDTILLVGGSSFMPQVKAALAREWPKVEIRLEDPHLSVVKGAAMIAASAPSVVKTAKPVHGAPAIVIRNITEKTYGLLSLGFPPAEEREHGPLDNDGRQLRCQNLVVRGMQIPAEKAHTVYTADDGQTSVRLVVHENLSTEREKPISPRYWGDRIGDAVLEFGRPVPRLHPVQVWLRLDIDGRIHFKGVSEVNGESVEVTAQFEAPGLLSADELSDVRERIAQTAVGDS